MKHFYIFLLGFFLLTLQIKAQSPNTVNYQGVARNASGLVLSNQNISLRFSIHQGSAGGTVVYQETKATATNQLGLFTVAVGSGSVVSGNFSAIDWAANTEYLQVEMDPTGGSSYLNMGTNQFLSVPYSLFADSSGASSSSWNTKGNANTTPASNFIGTTNANDFVVKTNGAERVRVTSAGNVGIGTPTPNSGAALDITSSTQGLLIPRMATAPASPSLGMQYFNTATGCFMFYNGTSWQAMICGCPNTPATPGTITSSTGSGNFCPGAAGTSYSITPLNNATGYTWTVPTDATITAGQGSNSIVVKEGTTSGSVSVSATNNCGTGAANTLAVTPIANNITGQPANASVGCAGGNATFTVTATGGGLTYQWQLNTGSGFTNVPGATNSSITISSPTIGMNGYQYQAIVTGTCSFTSNPATLTVTTTKSVPITITNSQGSSTSANLAVMLTIDFTAYGSASPALNANLNNIEFSTGPAGTGNPLYAWIESGTAPTAGTSTETAPTSSSSTAVVWINMGSTTIGASSSTTIYMTIMPSAVMTSTTSYTGMAPQWTGTYGQYDNGVLVFPSFYDNFAGTTLASKWTTGNNTRSVSNGLTVNYTNSNWNNIRTNTFTSSLNNIADAYCSASPISGVGTCINTSNIDAQLNDGNSFGTGGSPTSAPNGNGDNSVAHPVANTFYVLTFIMVNPAQMQLSYGLFESQTITVNHGYSIVSGAAVGLACSANSTGTYQWFRIRSNPPNSVMPSASVGSYGCY